jgi:hypothetical protein
MAPSGVRSFNMRVLMKPRKISLRSLRSGCERIEEQDGLDPRLERPDPNDVSPRVGRTVSLALRRA